MNPKVQALIQIAEDKILQERNKHLISLGLIDEERTSTKEIEGWIEGCRYDIKTDKYYKESLVAIEVADEEYSLICKYYPNTKSEAKTESKLEKNVSTIKKIMVFFTVLWGIGVLILLIAALFGF